MTSAAVSCVTAQCIAFWMVAKKFSFGPRYYTGCNNCRFLKLSFVKDALQVSVDPAHSNFEDFSHLTLRCPHGLALSGCASESSVRKAGTLTSPASRGFE